VPYRVSGRARAPESPDVDEALLKRHWSSRALVASLVYAPLVAWWLVMIETGNGPRQVTPGLKVAVAVAFALWLVAVLGFRARHQRAVSAAVARMEREATPPPPTRVADEPPRARGGPTVPVEEAREDDSDRRGTAERRS
jgi:hypothetical protein